MKSENTQYHTRTSRSSSFFLKNDEKFVPVKILGTGAYASVRQFESPTGRKIAVASPNGVEGLDEGARIEAQTKREFFQMLYEGEEIELIEYEEGYRLILPFIEGTEYNKIPIEELDVIDQCTLFLSAIQSIQKVHDNHWVIIDGKEDAFLFNQDKQKTFLV